MKYLMTLTVGVCLLFASVASAQKIPGNNTGELPPRIDCITDGYDEYLGGELARVLCGGSVPTGTRVSEQYLLDLEREVFLRLCGQRKTQERMKYMLEKGKPLRN